MPSDPEVRETALRPATDRLVDYDRAWPWIRGASAAGAAAGVIGGFFLLPLLWLVGLAAYVVAPVLFLRRRTRRRVCALRTRLLNAPWWVLALVTGVPFGVAMGVVVGVRDGDLPLVLYTGAAAGVFFGLLMGVVPARQNRRVREAMAVAPRQEPAVLRAVGKGPVPTDPAVREAALRLATLQHEQLARWRIPGLVLFGMIAVLDAVVAIMSNPWVWLWVALFVGFAALQLVAPRRVERRIAVLRDAGPADQHARG
ncbi:hypothetical protein [Pseudonocardia humida]|uniref:Sensor protein n=1 Tax=Pseudonocardia humida TaxID=2800819 RepID=A0ABT1A8M9_9PSEU|nr:hypothetical protein [Pseudonocardia humida]MCO1659382.1 hypothetical protein [Pseudonocardia humida]